jgi:putative lipoprotein
MTLTAFEVPQLALLLLHGWLMALSPEGEQDVVRGTVSYRERIALPPDAVVVVKLSDISRQDVAAAVIAETRVPSQGRQVPLSFELRYDPTKIDDKGLYAVRAVIESRGQTWFTTDKVYPVLTRGNPKEVDLVLTRAGGAARGLTGTAWRLEALGGARALEGVEATLEFLEEGKVAGKGSCNRFTGPVEIKGESISFGNLVSTRMACAEPIGNQELHYFEALRGAERFVLEGSSLSIYARGVPLPLRFVRIR